MRRAYASATAALVRHAPDARVGKLVVEAVEMYTEVRGPCDMFRAPSSSAPALTVEHRSAAAQSTHYACLRSELTRCPLGGSWLHIAIAF